ncbi:MAG TPA: AAA family ATPase [Oscillatoriaceae cyanobacterium M33_DOE_052]|uniref:ATP-binding protein n=1 Tax=Planktothricoides sp. SpSt-374 TaxID=2282167 RepID=A0A7C3VG13_9CYAN|nr:AAA family ATPase [Oscillatoriaceae cyanobacterium M33_DOE_052]
MPLDVKQFYRATNPNKTLVVANPEDKKYYIDFSSVRGDDIINDIINKITFFHENEPSCTLFTGHIGCGKSTELLRLKSELETKKFHVVYFESNDDLELTDVDTVDVLLAVARRISQSLDSITLEASSKLQGLLQSTWRILNADIQAVKGKIPGVGDVGLLVDGHKFTLGLGIGEITAKVKDDAGLRQRLNQFLGPQKTQLLDAINQELIQPAIAQLQQQGKQGLVVIVDNLDRIDNSPKPSGKPQQEYLFVDQGEYLSKLHCHLVYTMPLALKFSNSYAVLTQRFDAPQVLPMVPVQKRDGNTHKQGMALLRQMVLARALPDLNEQQRLDAIEQIFDSPATLDRLCRISGGHVRDLLQLLNTWISKERQFPLSGDKLEKVIRDRRNEMTIPISDEEWELLRQVRQRQKVSDDRGYQQLIRSRFVFEYRDNGEVWFDVNPILAEAEEMQP